MVIILGFYKRKPGLTHAEFCDHWLNVHGPVIKSVPGVEKYLIRYVQHRLAPETHYPTPDGMDFDGFSEGWFASIEARDEMFALPFFQGDAIEDERQFIDMNATRWVVLDDQAVIIPGPGAG